MSMDAAMNFVAKMRGDDKLQDQVLNAIAGKDVDTAAAAFVALGKEQGFTFSAEDAIVVYQRTQTPAVSGEMSGSELDGVSGGAFKPPKREPPSPISPGGATRVDNVIKPGTPTILPIPSIRIQSY